MVTTAMNMSTSGADTDELNRMKTRDVYRQRKQRMLDRLQQQQVSRQLQVGQFTPTTPTRLNRGRLRPTVESRQRGRCELSLILLIIYVPYNFVTAALLTGIAECRKS